MKMDVFSRCEPRADALCVTSSVATRCSHSVYPLLAIDALPAGVGGSSEQGSQWPSSLPDSAFLPPHWARAKENRASPYTLCRRLNIEVMEETARTAKTGILGRKTYHLVHEDQGMLGCASGATYGLRQTETYRHTNCVGFQRRARQ